MYAAFSRAAPAGMAEQFAEAYRLFRREPAYRELAQRFSISELLPEAAEFQ
ncbi:hypothetical protein D3C78_1892670 [compost metagenome]